MPELKYDLKRIIEVTGKKGRAAARLKTEAQNLEAAKEIEAVNRLRGLEENFEIDEAIKKTGRDLKEGLIDNEVFVRVLTKEIDALQSRISGYEDKIAEIGELRPGEKKTYETLVAALEEKKSQLVKYEGKKPKETKPKE